MQQKQLDIYIINIEIADIYTILPCQYFYIGNIVETKSI